MHGSQNKLEILWIEWKRTFEKYINYLEVKDPNVKRDLLLMCAGDDVTDFLSVWCGATDGDYETIVTTLDVHFRPEINLRFERCQFYSCVRQDRETIDDYFARLKTQAIACKFDDVHDRIVDHYIENCASNMLRHMLLRENDLTFHQLLDTVREFEKTENERKINVSEERRNNKQEKNVKRK